MVEQKNGYHSGNCYMTFELYTEVALGPRHT
jgi:hypothetical protein